MCHKIRCKRKFKKIELNQAYILPLYYFISEPPRPRKIGRVPSCAYCLLRPCSVSTKFQDFS